MNALLAFRSFAHNPKGVLAAVHRHACVGIEPRFNIEFRIGRIGLELSIAALTHADGWWWGFLYDPQPSVRHDCSLAHPAGERNPCANQTAPVPPTVPNCAGQVRPRNERTTLPSDVRFAASSG
jgi:hypothetical protein